VIRVIVNGKLRAKPFLDLRSRVKSDVDVQGLLSMAFHPDYVHNHVFYVDYTDRNGDTRVVRYRSNGVVGLPGTATRTCWPSTSRTRTTTAASSSSGRTVGSTSRSGTAARAGTPTTGPRA